MDRINTGRGFLHLIVSYEDADRYYTPELICLSFHKYLFKLLEEKSYDCVYFIDGETDDLRLDFANELSCVAYENEIKRSNTGFFHKKKDYSEIENKSGRIYSENDLGTVRKDPETVLKYISSLMQNRKAAVVMTCRALFDLIQHGNYIDYLKKAEKNKKQSILLLSINADMDRSAELFFSQDNERSILMSGLFPDALKKPISKEKGYIFLFDMLKKHLDSQLVFLDRFDYEDYKNICGHYFMKNISPVKPEFDFFDWFPLLLWVCARFPCFRYVWGIDLDHDTASKAKNIEKFIDKNFDRLATIADAVRSEYRTVKEYENEIEKYTDQDQAGCLMPVYSNETSKQIIMFEKLVKGFCDKYFEGELSYAPLECFVQLGKISSLLQRYRFVQNKDYNSEQAFNQYFEIVKKGMNYASQKQIAVLFTNKHFWDALYGAVKTYHKHMNIYSVGENIGDDRKHCIEKLYAAMIDNEIEIAYCMSKPKYVTESILTILNNDHDLIDPDSELDQREELRERASSCLYELKHGTAPRQTFAEDILREFDKIKLKHK